MEKIDLLLVNVGEFRKNVYQNLSKDFSSIEPPFWAALTSDFIRKKGFNVEILDANLENLSSEETARKIKEINPSLVDIVAYGQQPAASTQLMPSIKRLSKKIKEIDVTRKVLLTGLHPSALPERTIREEPVDYVGQGEGFHTLLGLLQKQEKQKIPGLWWKENNTIKGNKRPQNIENLSKTLSDVAWNLLPSLKNYKAHNWQSLGDLEQRMGYASISTSLGCPYACDFCSISATFGEHKIRFWNPEWVLKQMDEIAKKGVKNIKIIDELFISKPNHYLPIAKGLIERGYNFNIWAYARVDTTREEHLDTLKKAGFNWLCLGIEAGSEKIRNVVRKGRFKSEDVRRVVKNIKNAGINVLGNYVFGLPEDDSETIKETFDLAKELNCEFANFYSAMAYPGSQLYERSVKNNVRLPESWSGYSQHSYDCVPLSTKYLSSEEVLAFRDKAFDEYFTNPEYLKMVEEKFGKKAREHIKEMTKTKLKRKILGD